MAPREAGVLGFPSECNTAELQRVRRTSPRALTLAPFLSLIHRLAPPLLAAGWGGAQRGRLPFAKLHLMNYLKLMEETVLLSGSFQFRISLKNMLNILIFISYIQIMQLKRIFKGSGGDSGCKN